MPDSVAQIPCGPVIDLEHPLKLIGTHTLARLAQQIRSKKPFRERQMSIVKDRLGRHRELVAA